MTLQFDPALKELLLRRSAAPAEELDPGAPVPVIARLRDPVRPTPPLQVVSRFGRIVTGRAPAAAVPRLRRHPNVASLKASRTYGPSLAIPLTAGTGAAPNLEESLPDGLTGAGTVVAVLDWGVDPFHSNLLQPDRATRLLWLWDQRGGPHPESPEPFGYGRELTANRINQALASDDPYAELGYDPYDADRRGVGSHGTHVIDIATGNGQAPAAAPGVARGADLIFVHLRGDDTRPEDTLGDSVRVLEAVAYAVDRAGDRPLVVNLSLGRTGGPHDASLLLTQALDALLEQTPGVALVMSCGNYFGAGLHTAGRVEPHGYADLPFWVTSQTTETTELEVWYPGSDVVSVELIDPYGSTVAQAPLGSDRLGRRGRRVLATVYHRRHDPNNGDNQVNVFIWPQAEAGVWTVRLYGEAVVDGSYHAWIERESPQQQARFRPGHSVAYATTNSICNGRLPVAVGACANTSGHPILPFSSAGPSRDLRMKPDLVAPGGAIVAAKSSVPHATGRERDALTVKSGTSMAAPHVSGTVALMFEAAAPRRLFMGETRRILMETAQRPPPVDVLESLRYGAGRVDPVAACRSVQRLVCSPDTSEPVGAR